MQESLEGRLVRDPVAIHVAYASRILRRKDKSETNAIRPGANNRGEQRNGILGI